MAGIREELTLVDNFSGTFNEFNTAAGSSVSIAQRLKGALDEFKAGFMEGFLQEINASESGLEEIASKERKVGQGADDARNSQRNFTEEVKNSGDQAEKLVRSIRAAVAALGAGSLVKSFIESADEMALINTRLDMINDNSIKEASLQEAVYQAALRSRGVYNDTAVLVARIGQNAKDTFNNAEAVRFAEVMNKSFKLAGASQNEIQSATLQLSQALATGVLRGEEFNAVNESAPAVIQRIAESMGKSTAEMRQMAQEGKITADIVKNAMLGAAEEIDEEFEKLPMTWGDFVARGTNMLQMGISDIQAEWEAFLNTPQGAEIFDDVMSAIVTFAQLASEAFMAVVNGIAWVHENWAQLLPIIDVVIAAVLVYEAVQIAAALSASAAWVMANLPLIIFIGLIAVTIAWAQSLGVKFQQVGQVIGTVLGTIYAVGYNVFANLWNLIATFAEFFASVFNDPVGAVVRLFSGAFDSILGIVESVAGAIDTLLGTSMSGAIAGFRGKMSGWVADKFGESAVKIQRMANLDVKATATQWGNTGANIGGRIDEMNLSLNGIKENLGDIGLNTGSTANAVTPGSGGGVGKVGSVGKIEQDVKLSDEDLQIYRDLAEQRYMNKIELKTLAPKINVKVPKSANLSEDDVANAVRVVLIEQMAANTATAH